MAPGGGGNIKVVVRVRPFNSRGGFRRRRLRTSMRAARHPIFSREKPIGTDKVFPQCRKGQKRNMHRENGRNPDGIDPSTWDDG